MNSTDVTIRFDRIGRTLFAPDLTAAGPFDPDNPAYLDSLASAIHDHASQYLRSRWYVVTIDAAGVVHIEGGRFGRGQVVGAGQTTETQP